MSCDRSYKGLFDGENDDDEEKEDDDDIVEESAASSVDSDKEDDKITVLEFIKFSSNMDIQSDLSSSEAASASFLKSHVVFLISMTPCNQFFRKFWISQRRTQ